VPPEDCEINDDWFIELLPESETQQVASNWGMALLMMKYVFSYAARSMASI